ncbi:MAG: flagellar protein FlgN [Clostridiales bacterium]|nr:flagellar protein FlgN [Clostridiales bacterium]
MNELQSFLTATERCVAQCKTMLGFEQEKRQALLSDDLTRLENMIQAQQAAIMKLESLEKQRMEAQEKAGYHQLSAEEIIELLDEGMEKDVLTKQVGELKQTLGEIRHHNGKAMEIARSNLQIVNSLATGKEKKERQGLYRPGSAGEWRTDSSSTSFETKI